MTHVFACVFVNWSWHYTGWQALVTCCDNTCAQDVKCNKHGTCPSEKLPVITFKIDFVLQLYFFWKKRNLIDLINQSIKIFKKKIINKRTISRRKNDKDNLRRIWSDIWHIPVCHCLNVWNCLIELSLRFWKI